LPDIKAGGMAEGFNASSVVSLAQHKDASFKDSFWSVIWNLDNQRRAQPTGQMPITPVEINRIMEEVLKIPKATRLEIAKVVEEVRSERYPDRNLLKSVFNAVRRALDFRIVYDPHADRPLGEFRIKPGRSHHLP
jgi:hypothetical protein